MFFPFEGFDLLVSILVLFGVRIFLRLAFVRFVFDSIFFCLFFVMFFFVMSGCFGFPLLLLLFLFLFHSLSSVLPC